MQYYKFNKNKLKKILALNTKDWNKWNRSHLYSTCAACEKEYPYFDSPVLQNEIWDEVLNYFNLQEKQKQVKLQRKLQNRELIRPSRKNRLLFKQENCNVCKECMEKALNRKLTKNDLTECLMNEFIKIED